MTLNLTMIRLIDHSLIKQFLSNVLPTDMVGFEGFFLGVLLFDAIFQHLKTKETIVMHEHCYSSCNFHSPLLFSEQKIVIYSVNIFLKVQMNHTTKLT